MKNLSRSTLIFLAITCLSCENQSEANQQKPVVSSTHSVSDANPIADPDTITEPPSIPSLQDSTPLSRLEQIVHDTTYTWWIGGESAPWIIFTDDSLSYVYYGQCAYLYPVSIINGEIVMYWSYNMDCVFDAKLDTTFNLKRSPQVGKPFARFRLTNDSTLAVTYEYPQWVKRYNAMIKARGGSSNDLTYPPHFIREKRSR